MDSKFERLAGEGKFLIIDWEYKLAKELLVEEAGGSGEDSDTPTLLPTPLLLHSNFRWAGLN